MATHHSADLIPTNPVANLNKPMPYADVGLESPSRLTLRSTYPACCETEAPPRYKAGVKVCYHSLFHIKPE